MLHPHKFECSTPAQVAALAALAVDRGLAVEVTDLVVAIDSPSEEDYCAIWSSLSAVNRASLPVPAWVAEFFDDDLRGVSFFGAFAPS